MESRLRVGLVRAGLPRPEVQYEVRDEHGYPLARADLAYPAAKLAIEYDGEVHFSRQARERDLRRDGRLAGYGWLTLRLVADDVVYTMRQTALRVRELLALRTPRAPR
jgi:very-short-patch-repair endonuclease